MLPRKLHIEQINRFHDKLEELDKLMEEAVEGEVLPQIELSMTWYKLHKHWRIIDDAVEHTKDKIDSIENELRERK